jgi:protein-S-isoprenylcysteine O-methyltransferase Ste14
MNVKRHDGAEREFPHAHIYHALLPVGFLLIWFLDSQIFHFSNFFDYYVPFLIRLAVFIFIILIAITFIMLSHRILFSEHHPPNTLITNGIMAHVRNPMYFGILLIYVAFIAFSISLISIGVFVIVFLIYNKMVNFEENLLENMFGEKYCEYKRRVSKWFPH